MKLLSYLFPDNYNWVIFKITLKNAYKCFNLLEQVPFNCQNRAGGTGEKGAFSLPRFGRSVKVEKILKGSLDSITSPSVKVEEILKGSLDAIPSPSPSVKIQILGG